MKLHTSSGRTARRRFDNAKKACGRICGKNLWRCPRQDLRGHAPAPASVESMAFRLYRYEFESHRAWRGFLSARPWESSLQRLHLKQVDETNWGGRQLELPRACFRSRFKEECALGLCEDITGSGGSEPAFAKWMPKYSGQSCILHHFPTARHRPGGSAITTQLYPARKCGPPSFMLLGVRPGAGCSVGYFAAPAIAREVDCPGNCVPSLPRQAREMSELATFVTAVFGQ